MLVNSKVTPLLVQTGCENGWRDKAQKLNGSRLNEAPPPGGWNLFLADATPAPTLAEYASPEDHSEWVIYRINSLWVRRSTSGL